MQAQLMLARHGQVQLSKSQLNQAWPVKPSALDSNLRILDFPHNMKIRFLFDLGWPWPGLGLLEIWCNPAKLVHHFFQNKFKHVQRMIQSNQFFVSLKNDAIKPNYYHYFQTVLNKFKIWCNPKKLMYHYFQTALNMYKRWRNQNKLLHHYFKHNFEHV